MRRVSKLETGRTKIFDFLINVELKWKMSVDLLSLQQIQYISLPGEHKCLEISCEDSTQSEVFPIYITSRPQQEQFRVQIIDATFCNMFYRYMNCYDIYHNNMIFFVYSNISSYSSYQPASDDPNYSRRRASEFCKHIFYDLLYFTNREELDDFITMLLDIRDITFLEAVFIGLRYNELKVI